MAKIFNLYWDPREENPLLYQGVVTDDRSTGRPLTLRRAREGLVAPPPVCSHEEESRLESGLDEERLGHALVVSGRSVHRPRSSIRS